jgi:fucose permease
MLGAIATYISAVMPMIKEALSLSYSQVGTIFAAKSTGFLLGALLIGTLIDHVGTKKPLFFSFLTLPLGIIIFAFSKSSVGLIIGNFLIGIGASVIEVAIPPISVAFKGKSGKLLNLVHAFFALGAMISPLIASFMISSNLPYLAFLFIIAGYTCIPLYFSSKLDVHMPAKGKKSERKKDSGNFSILKDKFFWIIFFAVFFYVSSEIGVSSWASIYSADFRNYSKELSSLLPSIFWVGLLIGRFISSRFVDKTGHLKWLIIITCFGLPITFFSQMPLNSFWFMAAFMCLSGLIHASIYPTLQSLLVDTIHDHIGFALALFSGAASIGSMFAAFVIGNISTNFGIKWGYFTPFIMFTGVFMMIILFSVLVKKEK